MTADQLMGLVRQVLPLLGGLAIGLGWLTADQVGKITQLVLQIGGPLITLIGVIWAFVANSKASILTSAANMPEVKKIVLEPSAPEAPTLSQTTPNNVRIE